MLSAQMESHPLSSKLYPEQDVESFQNVVRKDILRELDGLDHAAILTMKSLIQAGLHEKNNMDAVNLREGYGTLTLMTAMTALLMPPLHSTSTLYRERQTSPTVC
mgnify:CR=1 FL=1